MQDTFKTIIIKPAMAFTDTREYKPPPKSRQTDIVKTMINLCATSHNLSCINFS